MDGDLRDSLAPIIICLARGRAPANALGRFGCDPKSKTSGYSRRDTCIRFLIFKATMSQDGGFRIGLDYEYRRTDSSSIKYRRKQTANLPLEKGRLQPVRDCRSFTP